MQHNSQHTALRSLYGLHDGSNFVMSHAHSVEEEAAPRCGVSADDRVDQGHDLDPVDFRLIAKKFVESFIIGNGALSSSNFETAGFSETLDWVGYFCNREQLFRSCYRRLIAVS